MTTVVKKPVDWFKPDANQPRKTFDEDELRLLGDDMRDNGQQQAVGALPDGTLIYGGRRFAAAKLAGLRDLEVKIYDGPLTPTQVKVIQLTENLHRADLSDQEVYLAAAELRRLNPSWQKQDLAAALHRSPSAITHILSVDNLIPAAREAFLGRAFGFSVAYEISKAGSPQGQHELLSARHNGASREAIARQHRKARNGNGEPAVNVSRLRCPLVSGAVVQVSLAGEGGIEEALEAVQLWIKEARRAIETGLDARTFERACRCAATKAKREGEHG